MKFGKVFSLVKDSQMGRSVVEILNCRHESTSSDGGAKTEAIDFVQQLFLDKIREYDKKKEESGGKMFDPIEELEKERSRLQEVLLKSFYKTAEPPSDLTAFPAFEFKDPPLDPVDSELEDPKKKKK